MEQIIKPQTSVLNILRKPLPGNDALRLMKYCVQLPVEGGTLLFHTLTREMLLLTPEETESMLTSRYLRAHWFTVPEQTNDKEHVDLVRWVCKNRSKKSRNITGYTILTTTDCNARCFYCYEKGYARVPMSLETADKVVSFIRENHGGEKVNVTWFGGEPLMNVAVIDRICQGLAQAGVEYISKMVSNAYLFCDEIMEKAAGLWNLRNVQITLDGTEDVYNRSKAYIHTEGSAYQVVIANIRQLLDAGIGVTIRLNMGLHNAQNLVQLAHELVERFSGQKRLRVYAHPLFDTEKYWDELYTTEQWGRLYDAIHKLEDILMQTGLATVGYTGTRRELPVNQCMADCGHAVVITPDGHLGLCEHFAESELIGHLDSVERDQAMIASWRELAPEIPECSDCFYYPECLRLKKCGNKMSCFEQLRQSYRRKTEQAMWNEYRNWLARKDNDPNPVTDGLVEDENC